MGTEVIRQTASAIRLLPPSDSLRHQTEPPLSEHLPSDSLHHQSLHRQTASAIRQSLHHQTASAIRQPPPSDRASTVRQPPPSDRQPPLSDRASYIRLLPPSDSLRHQTEHLPSDRASTIRLLRSSDSLRHQTEPPLSELLPSDGLHHQTEPPLSASAVRQRPHHQTASSIRQSFRHQSLCCQPPPSDRASTVRQPLPSDRASTIRQPPPSDRASAIRQSLCCQTASAVRQSLHRQTASSISIQDYPQQQQDSLSSQRNPLLVASAERVGRPGRFRPPWRTSDGRRPSVALTGSAGALLSLSLLFPLQVLTPNKQLASQTPCQSLLLQSPTVTRCIPKIQWGSLRWAWDDRAGRGQGADPLHPPPPKSIDVELKDVSDPVQVRLLPLGRAGGRHVPRGMRTLLCRRGSRWL